MKRIVVTGLVLFMILAGCAGKKIKNEKTAQELADEGTKNYIDGNYMGAVENFELLKDWYPFSTLATMAELKIADSYYHMEKYPEAVQWYQEFENLHPNNEAIPYVIYQTGRCNFDQLETIDRDPTSAAKALNIFTRLIREYPENVYSLRAVHHIDECQKRLAGHEFYIARFYFKDKKYDAALERFKSVITNYPDVGVHREALDYIALCEAKVLMQAENGQDDDTPDNSAYDASEVSGSDM